MRTAPKSRGLYGYVCFFLLDGRGMVVITRLQPGFHGSPAALTPRAGPWP